MGNNRLKWIDEVKGIAMVSVVLCHVVSGLYESNLFPESNTWLFAIRNLCNIFQMPLFCMASGYLFSKAYISAGGGVKRDRIKRQLLSLLSIYVLWCLLMGTFKILLSGKVNYEVRPIDLFLIWCKPIGVYWYLYVLIVLYLLFSFRQRIELRDRTIFIILLIISCCSTFFVENEGFFYVFRRIAYFGVFFFIGILLQEDNYNGGYQKISGVLTIMALILTFVFWSDEKEIYHIPIICLITALGFCFAIMFFFKNISDQLSPGILQIIGKNSLDIYLLHVFWAAGGRIFLRKYGFSNALITTIILFLISLFVPIILGIIARKLHVYDIFFKPYAFIEKIFVNKE